MAVLQLIRGLYVIVMAWDAIIGHCDVMDDQALIRNIALTLCGMDGRSALLLQDVIHELYTIDKGISLFIDR